MSKIKRLGLIKFGLNEFDAIEHMPYIEHLGMGYNPKMMDISWIAQAQSLKSVSFTNCKNITNWQVLGSLTNLETIIIENAGEIPSIDFLSHLPNLRKVRFIGQIDIKDNRIKHLLTNNNLQYFFIPVKKSYDITIADLRG